MHVCLYVRARSPPSSLADRVSKVRREYAGSHAYPDPRKILRISGSHQPKINKKNVNLGRLKLVSDRQKCIRLHADQSETARTASAPAHHAQCSAHKLRLDGFRVNAAVVNCAAN